MWHASGTAGDGDLGLRLVVMASGVTASAPERRPLHTRCSARSFRRQRSFSCGVCERRRCLTVHDRRRLVVSSSSVRWGRMAFHCDRESSPWGPFRSGRAARSRRQTPPAPPGRLHPRPLAAAEQLGQPRTLQAGRVRAADAGLARRSPTVAEARANPDVLANKTLKQVADHTAEVIGKLEEQARRDGAPRLADCWPRCSPPRALGSSHGGHRPGRVSAASCRCPSRCSGYGRSC